MADNVLKGVAAVLFAVVFWAFGGGVLFKTLSLKGFPVLWSAFIALGIAGVVLHVFSKFRKETPAKFSNKLDFFGLSVSNMLVTTFAYASFQFLFLGSASFLQSASIPLAPVLAWYFLKEKFSWKTVVGVFLAMAGIFSINSFSLNFSSIGVACALISALAAVATYLFTRKMKSEFNAGFASKVFLTGAALLFPFVVFFSPMLPVFTVEIVALVLGVGLFDLVLGDALRMYALTKAPVRIVSLFALLIGVAFSIVGFLSFGEVLPENAFFGGMLIILAGVFTVSDS